MIRWRQRGLRFKLTLGISLTMLVILGISLFIASQYIQNQLWQRETQAAMNLNAMTATILEDAMMVGRKDKIEEAIQALGQSVSGQIDSIAIYDDQEVLTEFATGFPGGRTIQRSSLGIGLDDPACWECHQLPPEQRPSMVVVSLEGKRVIRNVVPLYNEPRCQTCHGTGQAVLGSSIVDIELDQYQKSVATILLGLGTGIVVAVILVIVALYFFLQQVVITPLVGLVDVTQSIVDGNLDHEVNIFTQDEVGKLGLAFNSMTKQLKDLVSSLEQRVEERTVQLKQRTTYLEASAEIGQRAATVLEPNSLIQQIVDLIKDQLGLYYVGLFLVDNRNEWAILRAGTGEEGQAMIENNHRIEIGKGMIGWCITNAQARIAQDVGDDAVRFDNPFLPGTRTEGALPLRSRGRVLGALSVQSQQEAAFDRDTIIVLQTMADQVAIALDNAHLFSESQSTLEAERQAYGRLTRQAWQDTLRGRTDLAVLVSKDAEILPVSEGWTDEMVSASKNGRTVSANHKTIAVPIISRDQVLGVIRLRKNDQEGDWTDDEIDLMDTLVDQLESALESARLYEDTQRLAARERLVTEITTKIRSTNDPQEMLQTAVMELKDALGAQKAQVLINPGTVDRSSDDDHAMK